MLDINGYKYDTDAFGSLHQMISIEEYLNKLDFYSQNIYLDGRFYHQDANIDNNLVYHSIQKDQIDINHKFEILDNWELKKEVSKVLDLGCGYGLFIHEWAQRKYGVGYGYEISNVAQKISAFLKSHIDIRILNVNMIKDSDIESDTEMIVAFDFIEHLHDVSSFLSKISTICKQIKYFLVELPIIPKLHNYQEIINYKYFYPDHHIHLYTTAGIINEFNIIGFQLLSIEPLKSNLKNLLLFKNARIS
jgi:cyclopropane fatty-acyl-phospholipid synthase-like methyltransferase